MKWHLCCAALTGAGVTCCVSCVFNLSSQLTSYGGCKELCVHILFVMTKVLRVPPSNHIVWQLSLTGVLHGGEGRLTWVPGWGGVLATRLEQQGVRVSGLKACPCRMQGGPGVGDSGAGTGPEGGCGSWIQIGWECIYTEAHGAPYVRPRELQQVGHGVYVLQQIEPGSRGHWCSVEAHACRHGTHYACVT